MLPKIGRVLAMSPMANNRNLIITVSVLDFVQNNHHVLRSSYFGQNLGTVL
jgi:hypothetical protein